MEVDMDALWDAANVVPCLNVSPDQKAVVVRLIRSRKFAALNVLREAFNNDGDSLNSALMYSIIQRMQGSNIPCSTFSAP